MTLYLLGCLLAIVLAALLLRVTATDSPGASAPRVVGWLLLAGGMAALGLLMLALFTGRLGPQHFWFREPVFFVALAVFLPILTLMSSIK